MMCLSLVEPHGKHIAAKHQDTSNFSTDTANTRKKYIYIYIYIYTYIIRNTNDTSCHDNTCSAENSLNFAQM